MRSKLFRFIRSVVHRLKRYSWFREHYSSLYHAFRGIISFLERIFGKASFVSNDEADSEDLATVLKARYSLTPLSGPSHTLYFSKAAFCEAEKLDGRDNVVFFKECRKTSEESGSSLEVRSVKGEAHSVRRLVYDGVEQTPGSPVLFEIKDDGSKSEELSVSDRAVILIVSHGEKILPRGLDEASRLIANGIDMVLAPYCDPFGSLKNEHALDFPAVISGRLWNLISSEIQKSRDSIPDLHDHISRLGDSHEFKIEYCAVPVFFGTVIHEETVPSVLWWLQEFTLSLRPTLLDLFSETRSGAEPSEKKKIRHRKVNEVIVVSSRLEKIFSNRMRDEVSEYFRRNHSIEARLAFPDEVLSLRADQLMILLVHLDFSEFKMLDRLRKGKSKGEIVSWHWDNHHLGPLNRLIADQVDSVCVGHSFPSSYLRNTKGVWLGQIPLNVTQWTIFEASLFYEIDQTPRKSEIVGGFVNYEKAWVRNRLVDTFKKGCPESDVELFEYNAGHGYFAMNERERFSDWKGYKASLCVPLFYDLSQRFFDALLTGQYPLVVGEIPDLEKLADQLPELKSCFEYKPDGSSFTEDDAIELREKVLSEFDQSGSEGARWRHRHVIRNHMFVHRVEEVISRWAQSINETTEGEGLVNHELVRSINESIADRNISPSSTKVSVQHGLGNRMRAYASAKVLSCLRGDEFFLEWIPDHHCEATFQELFENEEQLSASEGAEQADCTIYNLVDNEKTENWKSAIDLDPSKHLFVKSQQCLMFSTDYSAEENAVLRSLVPSEAVSSMIDSVGDVSNLIGLHIRMEGGKDLSESSYDNPDQWDSKGRSKMFYWREKSHWTRFVEEINRIKKKNPDQRFFLACDQADVIAKLKEMYGEDLVCLERHHFDRSSEQIMEALADIYLLSRCRSILASNWSSFSEMAIRIGGMDARYAGVDF